MSRRRLVVASMVVLVTILGGVLASRFFHHDSSIEEALVTLPKQTLVANFTDWAAIRAALDPDVSSRSAVRSRAALFTDAYDRDYSTTSVLGVFDKDMASTYGWTVLDTEWEMYGQSKEGAVEVLRMPDGFDFDAADKALSTLGYGAPDAHGVRVADEQALAAIATGLTPQLTAIALLPDDHLIVTSDASAYAGLTIDTIRHDQDPVYDEDGVAEMAAALADSSLTVLLDVGGYGCTAGSFDEADPGQQALARERIEAVGGVSAIHGLTRSIDEGGRLTVVMDFDTPAQAEDNLTPRQALAPVWLRTRAAHSTSVSRSIGP